MSMPAERRRLLSAFLRNHREALAPDRIGPGAMPLGRRRTPGLRREEVAQRSGLSVTWYTWVEQGRDVALSAAALGRLADTLRLSNAERAYLFELAQRRDPSPPPEVVLAEPPPELAALLDATAAPAYVLDRVWEARGWNAAAARLFSPWLGRDERCLLRFVFLDPAARHFIQDWEDRARRLLAEFRADTAQSRDDPAIQALVNGLQRDSPTFARFWNDHAVLAREGGTRVFNHPQDGPLRYEQATLVPAAHPGCKFVVLLPSGPPIIPSAPVCFEGDPP